MPAAESSRALSRIAVLGAISFAGLLFLAAVNPPSRPVTSTAIVPNAAAPVQSVTTFKTTFTEHINAVIQQAPAQRGTTVFTTRIWRDFIDHTLWKTTNAQARDLSQAELTQLREAVNRHLDATVARKLKNEPGVAALGEGNINQDFFVGRLPAPPLQAAPLPKNPNPKAREDLKPVPTTGGGGAR